MEAEISPDFQQGLEAFENGDWHEAIRYFDHASQGVFGRSAMALRREAARRLRDTAGEAEFVLGLTSDGDEAGARHRPIEPSVVTGAGGRPGMLRLPARSGLFAALLVVVLLSSSLPLLLSRFNREDTLATSTLPIIAPVLDHTPVAQIDYNIVTVTAEPTATPEDVLTIIAAGTGALWQDAEGITGTLASGTSFPLISGGALRIDSGPDQVEITLADGSQLFLAAGAVLVIESVGGTNGVESTRVVLHAGKVILVANGRPAVVANPYGATVAITQAVAGVEFTVTPYRFEAHCFAGTCLLAGDLDGEVTLKPGQSSWVGGSGRPGQVTAARHERYAPLTGLIATPTATNPPLPTSAATPTRKPAGTPTATRPSLLFTATPTIPPVQDRDSDGVPDNADLCPDAHGFGSANGCPPAPAPGGDGDAGPPQPTALPTPLPPPPPATAVPPTTAPPPPPTAVPPTPTATPAPHTPTPQPTDTPELPTLPPPQLTDVRPFG